MLTNDCFEIKILENVYRADRFEIISKIKKGTILQGDQIKLDGFEWINIENVPEFGAVFEELIMHKLQVEKNKFQDVYTNFQLKEADYSDLRKPADEILKCCNIHPDLPPFFICTVCETLFCKTCPTIDGELKICLFCGGRCILYLGQHWQFEERKSQPKYNIEELPPVVEIEPAKTVQEKLTWADFQNALIYPFKHIGNLLIGGVLFSVLLFGLLITLFQSGWLLIGSLLILVVIMMLKFGILAKLFTNVEQNNDGQSFLPRLANGNFGRELVSPFFKGLSIYLVSFGLFILLVLSGGAYAWLNFSDNLDNVETQMIEADRRTSAGLNKTEQNSGELKKMLNERRIQHFETVFGRNHLVENEQIEKLIKSLTRMTIWFQMPICAAFVFGVIFFPAVCITIGRKNEPTILQRFTGGIKEMQIIGFDFVKIWLMCLSLILISGASILALSGLFQFVRLPLAGLVCSITLSSFLTFYFWVSFSTILSITNRKKDFVPD